MTAFVVTQDISSGRVHKRYPAESGYATHEADNLDEAGAYRIISWGDFVALSDDAKCQRCFSESERFPPTMDEDDGSTHGEVPVP